MTGCRGRGGKQEAEKASKDAPFSLFFRPSGPRPTCGVRTVSLKTYVLRTLAGWYRTSYSSGRLRVSYRLRRRLGPATDAEPPAEDEAEGRATRGSSESEDGAEGRRRVMRSGLVLWWSAGDGVQWVAASEAQKRGMTHG